jgi:outer membrane murein-binding lipoprotein Lpp
MTIGTLVLVAVGAGYLFGAAGPGPAVAQGTNPPPIIVDRITELQSAIVQMNRRVTTLEQKVKTLESDTQASKARAATTEASLKKLRGEFESHKHAR